MSLAPSYSSETNSQPLFTPEYCQSPVDGYFIHAAPRISNSNEDNKMKKYDDDDFVRVEDDYQVSVDKDYEIRTEFQKKCYDFFERPRSRIARTFFCLSAACILITVVMICVDSLPKYALLDWAHYHQLWLPLDTLVIVIFTGEYIGRFLAAVNKLKFVIRPMNLIDLLSILPFYIQLIMPGGPEAAFRFVRILRLFRVLHLFDFAKRSVGFKVTTRVIKRSLIQIFMVSFWFFIVLLLSSSLMYFLERGQFDEENEVWLRVNPNGQLEISPFQSIIHAFYWSIVTLTTTGYGDVTPYTGWGKVLASVTMICGILVIAMPTSIIGSNFVAEWTLHQRARYLAKVRKTRHQAEHPKTAISWQNKFLRKQNRELLEAITEVQEKLADVNPPQYYQRYKRLRIQYEAALKKIDQLEASLEKSKSCTCCHECCNNRSGTDNSEKKFGDLQRSWLSIQGLRNISRRSFTLPNDTDIDQKVSEKTITDETMRDDPHESKGKANAADANKLNIFKHVGRSLSLGHSDNWTSSAHGMAKNLVSSPFNPRPAKPLIVSDANDNDNETSNMTVQSLPNEVRIENEEYSKYNDPNRSTVGKKGLMDLFKKRKNSEIPSKGGGVNATSSEAVIIDVDTNRTQTEGGNVDRNDDKRENIIEGQSVVSYKETMSEKDKFTSYDTNTNDNAGIKIVIECPQDESDNDKDDQNINKEEQMPHQTN
ncbi:8042_t:CDS:2 [Paraglomus occultum]|uniref:8042_t:CDS:1 n=1 Tax=Paraglomus occultum TaxID=144539 RepID=A0A9N8VPB9_9GLOM|nr:8042_t:CDS:2 [Paraglomus occultum]